MVAGVAACSEKAADTPTAPEFRPNRTGCNFTTIQQGVNDQFTGSTDTYVSGLVNDAKLEDSDPAAADLLLYEALDTLSAQFGQGTVEGASTLAYQTLLCTSGGASGLNATTFVEAFGPTGAFAAVGYYDNDNRTVASRDNSRWVLHPPAGETWAGISTKDPLVIYGAPITIAPATFTADPPILSNIFDWRSHPSGVAFVPNVIVGNCEQGGTVTATYIQHNTVQQHPSSSGPAEILDFVNPDCSAALFRSVRLGFVDRMWRFFGPATAHASFFLPTSGGQKGALSPDAAVSPESVNLEFENPPNKSGHQVGQTLRGGDGEPLSVIAKSDGGTPFKQTQVFAWLVAANNSGNFVQVCNNWDFSDENGRFTFENAFLNKAGGYTVTVKTVGTNESTSAPGTPQLPPGTQPTTGLFNVKNGSIGNPAECASPNAFNEGDELPDPPGPPPVP
ncbi:MAG: hypothetical protein ACREOF_00355 [Gemmatimonadales bacterium]